MRIGDPKRNLHSSVKASTAMALSLAPGFAANIREQNYDSKSATMRNELIREFWLTLSSKSMKEIMLLS